MVQLTDNAVGKIKEILEAEEQTKNDLRIYVEGGGCSGFQYGFQFDDSRMGDEVHEFAGFRLLIDPFSNTYLSGAQVDYVDGLDGAGFRISNPNASGTCGCGHSFSV